MAKITYTTKDKYGTSPVNKGRDVDFNEIKTSVNILYDNVTIGVKRYKALLTQSGENAPTTQVLENTLGTLTFVYQSDGDYLCTSSGLFTQNKTVVLMGRNPDPENVIPYGLSDVNTIIIKSSTINIGAGEISPVNGIISNTLLLIEVYP